MGPFNRDCPGGRAGGCYRPAEGYALPRMCLVATAPCMATAATAPRVHAVAMHAQGGAPLGTSLWPLQSTTHGLHHPRLPCAWVLPEPTPCRPQRHAANGVPARHHRPQHTGPRTGMHAFSGCGAHCNTRVEHVWELREMSLVDVVCTPCAEPRRAPCCVRPHGMRPAQPPPQCPLLPCTCAAYHLVPWQGTSLPRRGCYNRLDRRLPAGGRVRRVRVCNSDSTRSAEPAPQASSSLATMHTYMQCWHSGCEATAQPGVRPALASVAARSPGLGHALRCRSRVHGGDLLPRGKCSCSYSCSRACAASHRSCDEAGARSTTRPSERYRPRQHPGRRRGEGGGAQRARRRRRGHESCLSSL